MKIESWQETDPDLIEKSRARFGDEINNLRSLGFLELCHYTEMLPPFSLATFFFGFLLMIAKREIVRVESPLRIIAAAARRVKVRETWLSFSASDWNDFRSISSFFFRAARSISIVLRLVGVTARAIFRGMR